MGLTQGLSALGGGGQATTSEPGDFDGALKLAVAFPAEEDEEGGKLKEDEAAASATEKLSRLQSISACLEDDIKHFTTQQSKPASQANTLRYSIKAYAVGEFERCFLRAGVFDDVPWRNTATLLLLVLMPDVMKEVKDVMQAVGEIQHVEASEWALVRLLSARLLFLDE